MLYICLLESSMPSPSLYIIKILRNIVYDAYTKFINLVIVHYKINVVYLWLLMVTYVLK